VRETFHEFPSTHDAAQPNIEVALRYGPRHGDKLTLGASSLQSVDHHEQSRPTAIHAVSIVKVVHDAFSAWTATLALTSSGVKIWVLAPRASRKFRCHSSNTSKSQITPARSR